jgi:dTDP-D-glucose 4,6-dehydratase
MVAMKMRLLITGAAGFIGTNLLKKLETRIDLPDLEVLTVDMIKPDSKYAFQKADLTSTDYAFLDDYKPTHVIHLAALTNHRLCASLDNAMDVNVYSTERLFSKLYSLGGVKK